MILLQYIRIVISYFSHPMTVRYTLNVDTIQVLHGHVECTRLR